MSEQADVHSQQPDISTQNFRTDVTLTIRALSLEQSSRVLRGAAARARLSSPKCNQGVTVSGVKSS